MTGGAGFIGSHVVERLVACGVQVSVLDDFSAGDLENLAAAFRLGLSEKDVHALDICTADVVSLVATVRPEIVIHLAARSSVQNACEDPAHDATVNVAGTANVIHASARAGVSKVVFASSCAIYGEVADAELPISERHRWAPIDPYGVGKETGIRYLQVAKRMHGLDYVALVLGNVYGPRQKAPSAVPAFLDACEAGQPALLHGSGNQSRDFVHVSDVAQAIVSACERGGDLVVNVGSGVETSVRDLQRFVRTAASVQSRSPKRLNQRSGGIPRMCLDVGRASTTLAWAPRISLPDGLGQLIHERRANAHVSRELSVSRRDVCARGA